VTRVDHYYNCLLDRDSIDVYEMPLTAISARRTLSGTNQARGKLTAVITNNYPEELEVIYLETMPWLLQFYLHTLQVHYEGDRHGT
jgi:GPI-anchor transamidase subunit T